MFKVVLDCCGEYHEETFNDYNEAWEAYEKGANTATEYGDGYCKLYEDEEVLLWEIWADDEYDGYDLCDNECGFNPYMGCYDYDC